MVPPSPLPVMAAAAGGGRGLWERLRGTRIARWWGSLLQDYSAAGREVIQGAAARPGGTVAVLLGLGGTAACWGSVPTAESFEENALDAAGTLLLLSPATRSPSADRHVQHLLRLRATGRLRYRHLGVLAVMYEAPHPPEASLYSARCPYLRRGLQDFLGALLDVGFGGRWWVLGGRLRDCDVNEEEFGALPEGLRVLSPRHLRSHRNEREFLEKFQPVLLTPQQIQEAMEAETPPQRAGP